MLKIIDDAATVNICDVIRWSKESGRLVEAGSESVPEYKILTKAITAYWKEEELKNTAQ
jgi:hypothetical protein